MPITATGIMRSVIVPSPTSPRALVPPQIMVPPGSTAQEFVAPRETETASSAPAKVIGVDRMPVPLIQPRTTPQQYERPERRRTQVWFPPASMAMPSSTSRTSTGETLSVVIALPS